MSEKPILKIGFADYCSPIDKFFIDLLSKEFSIIRDDNFPDYLFFCDETFGHQNQKFNDRNVIKIFFTGENRRWYNYPCHFAVTFDFDNTFGDQSFRHFRLPGYASYLAYFAMESGDANFSGSDFTHFNKIRQMNNRPKESFCSFVVRNGNSTKRNEMFNLLSRYKKVDSAGSLFNNMGYNVGPNISDKISFFSKRKFALVYENSSYPGYVTEKLPDALLSSTIPIYWGCPAVALDFNPKSFISRHEFDSDEEMIQKIIELDNDDEKYHEIISEPMFKEENRYLNMTRFTRWFKNTVYRGVLNP